MFMLHGRIAAHDDRRDELLSILAEQGDAVAMPGCRLYVVATDPDDDDGVWVTELWESEEAHQASLQLPEVRERITRALPMIDREGIRQQRLETHAGVPAAPGPGRPS